MICAARRVFLQLFTKSFNLYGLHTLLVESRLYTKWRYNPNKIGHTIQSRINRMDKTCVQVPSAAFATIIDGKPTPEPFASDRLQCKVYLNRLLS